MINTEEIYNSILKYSQNKKKKYRLSRIELFNYILAMNSLVDQAGYIYTYNYNHLNSNSNQHIINILNDSSKIINHFNQNIVWVTFPLDRICLVLSINTAFKFPLTKDIFKEGIENKDIEKFQFEFYDHEHKSVMKTPYIIISNTPLKSVVFDDETNLETHILNKFYI